MDKAIDNYAVGKQIEVKAWKGQSVSADSRRFFCPECMESVALDIRGHFRHRKKTAQSIECEKRVDSPSRTAYERMGLPLFIKSATDTIFNLYIGFPALEDSLLTKATHAKASLTIKTGSAPKIKLNISQDRFNDDHFSYFQLSFLPSDNGRYQIEYENTPALIKNKWTTYSDIWGRGQFFKVSDGYARKIRSLGTIVADQNYYFVGDAWYFKQHRQFVDIQQIGTLNIGGMSLALYIINIHYAKASPFAFSNFSAYLMEKYHLNLLIGDSELTPLWPPCIIDENYFIFPSDTTRAFMLIDSPNDSPAVYKYEGHNYHELSIVDKKPSILAISPSEIEVSYSVDKAFNGNIQFIRKQQLQYKQGECIADIFDEAGASIVGTQLTKIRHREFLVKSDCSSIVFLIKQSGENYQYTIDSEEGICLSNLNWNDSIIVISKAGTQLLSHVFERNICAEHSDSKQMIAQIRKMRGQVIPVDSRVLALYKKTSDNSLLQREIEKYIRLGSIPSQVVSLLKETYGGK